MVCFKETEEKRKQTLSVYVVKFDFLAESIDHMILRLKMSSNRLYRFKIDWESLEKSRVLSSSFFCFDVISRYIHRYIGNRSIRPHDWNKFQDIACS